MVPDQQDRIIFRRTTISGAGRNNIPQEAIQTAQGAINFRRNGSNPRRKGLQRRRRPIFFAGRASNAAGSLFSPQGGYIPSQEGRFCPGKGIPFPRKHKKGFFPLSPSVIRIWTGTSTTCSMYETTRS